MRWVAFFSQTGSEVCELSNVIGFEPSLVVTDSKARGNKIDNRIYKFKQSCFVNYRDMVKQQRLNLYRSVLNDVDLITLHGWLNIVPGEICNEYKIYNGHPGLITRYPELKGKDPQIRFASNIQAYPTYGSVVHRVTPEVDEGEIISFYEKETPKSVDNCFGIFKETSLEAWIEFFDSYITIKL